MKGRRVPWPGSLQSDLQGARFVRNDATPTPASGEHFLIKAGGMEARGDPMFYGSVLADVSRFPAGCSVAEIMASQKGSQERNVIAQAVSFLMHGGWILPVVADFAQNNSTVAKACNQVLAQDAFNGAPYRWACLPMAGGSIAMGDTEMMMLHLHLKGVKQTTWPAKILEFLSAGGRALAKDGKAMTDPNEQHSQLQRSVEAFCSSKLPMLERLGGI